MIGAAPGAVHEWVVVAMPGASLYSLLPGLMEAQVGSVDETTQDQVSVILTEVIKRHPVERGRERRERDGRKSGDWRKEEGGRTRKCY